MTHVCYMKVKNTISALVRALACLTFAVALVLSAPSVSHAESGPHALNGNAEYEAVEHSDGVRAEVTEHEIAVTASKTADEEQSSSECCSGFCFSAAFSDADAFAVDRAASKRYLMLHAQTNSIESSGFLRPPQFLI